MTNHVKSAPDFVPGPWISYGPEEFERVSEDLQSNWGEYFRVRHDMYGRGSLQATAITRMFGAALMNLETTLAELRGCPVQGKYQMPSFYDDYDRDRLPRSVKFLGSGGFRYAKEFRGIMGRLVASDAERILYAGDSERQHAEVIEDELLVPVWPLSYLDNASTRSFASRPEALQYGHAFGIKEFAGNAALLPLDYIAELRVDRELAPKDVSNFLSLNNGS